MGKRPNIIPLRKQRSSYRLERPESILYTRLRSFCQIHLSSPQVSRRLKYFDFHCCRAKRPWPLFLSKTEPPAYPDYKRAMHTPQRHKPVSQDTILFPNSTVFILRVTHSSLYMGGVSTQLFSYAKCLSVLSATQSPPV